MFFSLTEVSDLSGFSLWIKEGETQKHTHTQTVTGKGSTRAQRPRPLFHFHLDLFIQVKQKHNWFWTFEASSTVKQLVWAFLLCFFWYFRTRILTNRDTCWTKQLLWIRALQGFWLLTCLAHLFSTHLEDVINPMDFLHICAFCIFAYGFSSTVARLKPKNIC